MKNRAEVIIIGGGIQGISLAYHLAERGLTDICLLEMDMLGSGSSGKSASVICHAFQSEISLPLTRWSFEALMRFEQEIGVSPGYEPIGCLLIGGSQGMVELRRRHQLLQGTWIENRLVDLKEIGRLIPGLNLAGIEGGLYLPQDGGLDPHSIMMGYASQARRRGVRFEEGVEALNLIQENGRVRGVLTTAGSIEAKWVVNAAGSRARDVGSWAGLDLPIRNCKRHILVTGAVEGFFHPIPFTYEWEKGWYLRREGPGFLIGMGVLERAWDDVRVEPSFIEELIDYASFRAPALEDAGLMTTWASLRPLTPDDDPILGPTPQLAGFINDCGWGGHGVMNAPAAGMALAELIPE
ncbi:MAG: FAD-binding oxidoreductase [Anaerolineales bacterium]|nr:FAD-binding oxidoreductase [Anaerolineales bacterium]